MSETLFKCGVCGRDLPEGEKAILLQRVKIQSGGKSYAVDKKFMVCAFPCNEEETIFLSQVPNQPWL